MEDTLGKRIVYHRKRLGLTQDQLAEKLGVTAQAVSKWENDQSCPDISVLPLLADLFGISVDALLGHAYQEPAVETDVVDDTQGAEQPGRWQMTWESKKGGIGIACLVLSVGTLLLLSSVFSWGLSFWDALWPTTLLIVGLFTLFPQFSFLSLGCTLLGGYFLADKIMPLNIHVESSIVWASLILIFGLSLLIGALRGKKKHIGYSHIGPGHKGKRSTKTLNIDDKQFVFEASFSESRPTIAMPLLEKGVINVSFGDHRVDLQGVDRVSEGCVLEANCSFGELKLLVPARFMVEADHSSSFAGFTITGAPDPSPTGTIHLDANVSFGEIQVIYI